MAVCVLLRHFSIYVYIGVLNTLIHWGVFLTLHSVLSVRQLVSNVCAFAAAATFSVHANSLYTLNRAVSLTRSQLLIGFMVFLSFATGWLGDGLAMPGVLTLFVFSGASLAVAYLSSCDVIFWGKAI